MIPHFFWPVFFGGLVCAHSCHREKSWSFGTQQDLTIFLPLSWWSQANHFTCLYLCKKDLKAGGEKGGNISKHLNLHLAVFWYLPGPHGWLGIAVCREGFVHSPQGLADVSGDLKQPSKNSSAELLNQVYDCNYVLLFGCSLQQNSAKAGFSSSPTFTFVFSRSRDKGLSGLSCVRCTGVSYS